MARVPRHFRDKLVSSKTGVNTLDTSGRDTNMAIAKMADQFIQVAGNYVREQKDATDRSEAASKQAEYTNKSSIAAQQIQKDYAENPEEGYRVLTEKNKAIKDEVLSTVSNGRLKNQIGASIDGISAQQSVNNKKWEINRMSAMEQQFLVDVQQMNIDTIMQGATADEYEIMLGDDTFTEENYKKAWDPEKGVENFRTAKDAMFRARATKLMEEGRFFEAQDFIEKREEPTEKTRREVRQNFLKMQKGARQKKFFETVSAASVDVVEIQEKTIADEMKAGDLDDRVLAVSAQANDMKDEEVKKVLVQYAGMLADIRDIKMEQILLTAPGDTNVESTLQSQYERLVKKGDGISAPRNGRYLQEFLDFQNAVVAEAKKGNVSASHYNQWMYWSKVALQDFEPKAGWGNNVDPRGMMRKRVQDFFKDNPDKSNTWKIDALREVYDNLPSKDPKDIGDEKAQVLFKRGKIVATLKEMGYPVDIVDSKVIRASSGTYKVVDFDQSGMPVVDVTTANMER